MSTRKFEDWMLKTGGVIKGNVSHTNPSKFRSVCCFFPVYCQSLVVVYTYWPTKHIVRKNTWRATCWYVFSLRRSNLVQCRPVCLQKRNTIWWKGAENGRFPGCFWLVHFDPHINEAGLYKPRFFQVRHRKSSSLGEALSVWIAFFGARSLLLYFNCSFQNKVFIVWFVNCSFKNKSLFYCCNCSFWNNIVAVLF